jgi:predicted DNA binding CopG/RHH family protein
MKKNEEKKIKTLQIRVSASELEEIKRRAKSEFRELSDYVRFALLHK